MKHSKLIVAMLIASSALVGCGGGDEGDDVVINVGGGGVIDDGNKPTGENCDNVVAASFIDYNNSCTEAEIEGTITENFTLTSDVEWQLKGMVRVGRGNEAVASAADVQLIKDSGVTLTIEAGTEIRSRDDGTLLVTRGSKLMAEGTSTQPITFSSLADRDYDGYGEWGGVIIQGFAPQYGQGGTGICSGENNTWCNVDGEGGAGVGVFGGVEPADNSGVIKYVRIAEGGLIAGPGGNEINGLTLQGVGHGTTIEYVQVHDNLDDGIEWFGGTVNAKYLVLTGNDDDDIDFDEGYQGNMQHIIIQKDPDQDAPFGENDPRGIEANSDNKKFTVETQATIANVLILGSSVNNSDSGKGQQPGMRLRGAVTANIYNSAVKGFDLGCIRIDDAVLDNDDDKLSAVKLENVLGDCESGYYQAGKEVADSGSNQTALPFSVGGTYAINETHAVLGSATDIVAIDNGSNFQFDMTSYIGAVDPATNENTEWWRGWTIPGSLAPANLPKETAFADCNDELTECELNGRITEDYTLVRGVAWTMGSEVIVGEGNLAAGTAADVQVIKDSGVTLTIEPGVHVKAKDTASLIVTRGSKLRAEGTATSPITFSSLDDGYDGLGEWGGVIIQGFAPQYGQSGTGACFGTAEEPKTCNVAGEGGTIVGNFGGDDPADDSGIIKYVRIAEGGLVAGPGGNEINGLTLQGVGYGTTIEYVQVHNNLDDGVEWFGGTVNAKYLVLTNNDDDDIDFDEGYQGNIQYAIVRKHPTKEKATGENDPRGIEANSSNSKFVVETQATLANILIIGSDVNNSAENEEGVQPGMRLRGAVTANIYNTAVKDFDVGCVRIDNAVLADAADIPSVVAFTNVLGSCVGGFYTHEEADPVVNSGLNDVTVNAVYALTDAEAALDTAPTITPIDNGSNFVFDETDFVGAVAPGTAAEDAWWSGWIIEGSL